MPIRSPWDDEIARLKAVNADLLAALEKIACNASQMATATGGDGGMWRCCADEARAAIAKVQS